MLSYQGGLSLGCCLIRVDCHWGAVLSGWSVIGVVPRQGGLSLGCCLIGDVCHHSRLSSGWSLIGGFTALDSSSSCVVH